MASLEELSAMDSLVRAYGDAKRAHAVDEERLLQQLRSGVMSTALFAALEAERAAFDSLTDAADDSAARMEARAAVRGPNTWSPKLLARHCGLLIDDRRLAAALSERTAERMTWGEVVRLRTTLANLRGRADMTTKQHRFLESVETELMQTSFERRDLRRVTAALSLKLSEQVDALTVTSDVTKHADAVTRLLPDLANCEQLLEAALQDGDVALAEDVAENQIRLYERLLQVTEEQFPMLQAKKNETREFIRRRRWAIFRMANRDINGVVESKHRHVEACEEDLGRLRDFVDSESSKDTEGRERFKLTMAESDAFLQQNKRNQLDTFGELSDLYDKVRACEAKLLALGTTRKSEMGRRLELIEEEAARTHEFRSLVAAADQHVELLRTSIAGAEQVREVCKQLNDFLLDGCDDITAKFERSAANMDSLIASTNRQYLKLFSGYAVAVGRLRYRKDMRRRQLRGRMQESEILLEFASETLDARAKKHADDRTEAAELAERLSREIDELSGKLEDTAERFAPCASSLRDAGVSFVHPLELAAKANIERQATIVEFREAMNVTERKIEDQVARDVAEVRHDIDDHRLHLMRKQAATHMRHAHQAAARAPRPPKSKVEQLHAVSFSRYKQLISELNHGGGAPAASTPRASRSSGPLSGDGDAAASPPLLCARPASTPGIALRSSSSPLPLQSLPAPTTLGATPPGNGGRPLPRNLEGATLVCLFAYKARAADELSFAKGDRIICIGAGPEPGWYEGVCNQRTGLFPVNYVASATTDADELLDVD